MRSFLVRKVNNFTKTQYLRAKVPNTYGTRLYIPYSYIKKAINKKVLIDSSKAWTLKQSNHIKRTINLNNNLGRDLQKLMNIRKEYRLAIHLMTGHIALNHHLNTIKVEASSLCPHCLLESETVGHFLGKCPVFYYLKQYHFDTHFSTLAELTKNTVLKNIIKYTIDTKRLDVAAPVV